MTVTKGWSRRDADHGQATMLVLAAVVFVALLAIGVGAMGQRLARQSRARTAADAAALAGTTSGEAGARRVAERNGATLVAFASSGDPTAVTVTVVVDIGGQRATARATNGP